eukprot:jgi/Tetstr1/436310/TSEL_025149.t1
MLVQSRLGCVLTTSHATVAVRSLISVTRVSREACELKADELKHIVRRFKPNSQHKLKNLDKQLARQALERMRGGHPQQGATAPTASASASAASAATAAAPAESANGGD